jgi:molecular chaperone GrpE
VDGVLLASGATTSLFAVGRSITIENTFVSTNRHSSILRISIDNKPLAKMLVSWRVSRTFSNKMRGLLTLQLGNIKTQPLPFYSASEDLINQSSYRHFSDGGPDISGAKQADSSTSTATEQKMSKTDELETQVKDLNTQLKDLRDQLLRSLAEQDNTRRIAKRDVDAARSFAITSFAKSLLDTSDNLSRAMEAVPIEYRTDTINHPVLATLYEGIRMTDDNLTKAFEKNGLRKFGKVGDKFDPNLHSALFEYPDASKAAGTIGQVMKIGFTLNDRVIRPAEVGVIRHPPS